MESPRNIEELLYLFVSESPMNPDDKQWVEQQINTDADTKELYDDFVKLKSIGKLELVSPKAKAKVWQKLQHEILIDKINSGEADIYEKNKAAALLLTNDDFYNRIKQQQPPSQEQKQEPPPLKVSKGRWNWRWSAAALVGVLLVVGAYFSSGSGDNSALTTYQTYKTNKPSTLGYGDKPVTLCDLMKNFSSYENKEGIMLSDAATVIQTGTRSSGISFYVLQEPNCPASTVTVLIEDKAKLPAIGSKPLPTVYPTTSRKWWQSEPVAVHIKSESGSTGE